MSAPLAKTDEIVLIGGSDRTTQEINKLVGTLPPAIQALTGVDLTGVRHSILSAWGHLKLKTMKMLKNQQGELG